MYIKFPPFIFLHVYMFLPMKQRYSNKERNSIPYLNKLPSSCSILVNIRMRIGKNVILPKFDWFRFDKNFFPPDWNWISPIALGIAIECLSKSIVRNKVKLFEMKTLDLHCDRARLEIRSNMIYFRSIGYCFLLLGRIYPHFRKSDTKIGEIFQLTLIHCNFDPWYIYNIFDLIYLDKLLNRRI